MAFLKIFQDMSRIVKKSLVEFPLIYTFAKAIRPLNKFINNYSI
jgi:hypothetical protein